MGSRCFGHRNPIINVGGMTAISIMILLIGLIGLAGLAFMALALLVWIGLLKLAIVLLNIFLVILHIIAFIFRRPLPSSHVNQRSH